MAKTVLRKRRCPIAASKAASLPSIQWSDASTRSTSGLPKKRSARIVQERFSSHAMALLRSNCVMPLQITVVRYARSRTEEPPRGFAWALRASVVEWLCASHVSRAARRELWCPSPISITLCMSNLWGHPYNARTPRDVPCGAKGTRRTDGILCRLLLQESAYGTRRNQGISERTRTVTCSTRREIFGRCGQATCKPISEWCISKRCCARAGRML